jgi:hypothetical protein
VVEASLRVPVARMEFPLVVVEVEMDIDRVGAVKVTVADSENCQ